ncbi:MAG: radical SAM protein, partial [Nitrososphaera sp.]|nr:radical SAM protein [Nitrososphaera sp.]
LGGRNYSKQHISETARILNETSPDFVGALTLYLEERVHDEFMNKFGEEFIPLDDIEVLDELERLVTDFDPTNPVIFRANHASNLYSLGGTMPDDKQKLLSLLSELKKRPELLRPKFLRRF